MKILLGFHYHDYPLDVQDIWKSYLARISAPGVEVTPFPLTLQARGRKEDWKVLDRKWKIGDTALMRKYESLATALEGHDVFFNYASINVHPEFLSQLPSFNVMAHFDDPENSEQVSKPVAHAYDLCLVGNAAEVETYKAWGAKAVFWPLGFRHDDYDPRLTEESILKGDRDVDMTILCERDLVWRRARLDAVAAAFPQGRYHGLGWPAGFLAESERVPLLQRTKVGINIHNSTGPINFRTYALPANGVMQVCDNKSHLGQLFELGKEVVGFDTVEEGIDLARYYLDHDEERREIAAAGFRRSLRDYNEKAVWRLAVDRFKQEISTRSTPRDWSDRIHASIQDRQRRKRSLRWLDGVISPFRVFNKRMMKYWRAGINRLKSKI
jgi:hypothetical protein